MCWQFLLCSAFSSRLPQLSLPTTYLLRCHLSGAGDWWQVVVVGNTASLSVHCDWPVPGT